MNRKGFTLIELLMVVSIMTILLSASAPIYRNFQVSTQINEATSQITHNLRVARERSLAGYNNSSHGVFFDISPELEDKIILYQGSSYETRVASFDRKIVLEKSLSISTSLIGNDINFSKGLAEISMSGNIILNHKNSAKSSNIYLNSYGISFKN